MSMNKEPVKTTEPKLTAEHFYKFFQCPHWVWYDIYGDQSRKKEVPAIIEIIYKRGLRDEKSVLSNLPFEEIKPEMFSDLEEAFLATLELMKQGKNIYHGVLMDKNWVGIPDLLQAKEGKSNFGDFYYEVYDIKNAREIKDEFKFQLVFYSLILERIQGVLPKEAHVITPEGQERTFLVDDFLDYFHFTRESIEKILEGEKPPPFLKSGCKHSPWYSLCQEETKGCGDVSLIYRLSQGDQRRFYQIGVRTVEDLAKASLDDLRYRLEDWNFDKIVRFQNQAKVLLDNAPLVLRKSEFPPVATEIYFDVESDPTQDIDYLLGFLVKKDGKEEYRHFFARDKNEEKENWNKFLDFLEELDDFVIYHYSYYEREVFDRLGKKYGLSLELDKKFKDNLIDLQRAVQDAVILPLYFYSLKDIAKYMGFSWRAEDAGGAESVVWYNDWQKSGDEKILDKIVKYNEDDVRATLFVKEWLEKQKPRTGREQLPQE